MNQNPFASRPVTDTHSVSASTSSGTAPTARSADDALDFRALSDAAANREHRLYGEGATIICDNLVKIYKIADLEVVALQGLDLLAESSRVGEDAKAVYDDFFGLVIGPGKMLATPWESV